MNSTISLNTKGEAYFETFKGFSLETFKKTFLLFLPYLFKDRWRRFRFGFACLLIFVDVAAVSLVPYCSKQIVDTLALDIQSGLWIIVSMLGLFWVLEKTVSHVQEIIFFPVVNLTIRDLYFQMVQHIHQISLLDYQSLSIAEVINCIRRISMSARNFIKILFLMIFPTLIKLSIATMVCIHAGSFGYFLLPAIVLALVILYKGAAWSAVARDQGWQATDKAVLRMNDSILNTKLVRFFNQIEAEEMQSLLKTEASLWHTHNTRLHMIYVLIGILLGITIIGILSGAIIGIQNKNLTIGDFVLLKGQLIAAFLPLKTLAVEFRMLAESLIDIKKVVAILEIPKEINPNGSSNFAAEKTYPQYANGIYLKNIYFAHAGKTPLFKDFSLSIHSGEKVAIIGKSGCGKSTLINIMASLYKPTAGELYMNGKQVLPGFAASQEILKSVHFIPQDFQLFNQSLRYNLCYGLPPVTDTDLLKICKEVGLMEVILEAPLGLNTLVGEMGTKLSGGEKQKVALARALLLKPDILLLDETTNSLNQEMEKKILEVIFSRISTVVLTSHRTSILAMMDRVLKIENGQLQREREDICIA